MKLHGKEDFLQIVLVLIISTFVILSIFHMFTSANSKSGTKTIKPLVELGSYQILSALAV